MKKYSSSAVRKAARGELISPLDSNNHKSSYLMNEKAVRVYGFKNYALSKSYDELSNAWITANSLSKKY